MRREFDRSGEISQVDVLAGLQELARRRADAELTFTREGESLRFRFDGGDLVEARTPEDIAPGSILIRSGKILAETLDALSVEAETDRFATAVASGLVSKREAAWARKLSSIEALSRLLAWPDGSYACEDSVAFRGAEDFRLPVRRWILELFLRSSDRALILQALGPSEIPLVKTADFEREFSSLGLTADADAVVSGIDGKRSAARICRHAPADEFAVLKLLAALTCLGLIRPELEEAPPSRDAGEIAAEPRPEAAHDPASAPQTEPPFEPEPGPETEPEPETWDAGRPEPFDVGPEAHPAPTAAREIVFDVEPPETISIPLAALTSPETPEEEASEGASTEEPSAIFSQPAPERSRRGFALLGLAVAAAAVIYLSRRQPAAPPSGPPTAPAPRVSAPALAPAGPTASEPVPPERPAAAPAQEQPRSRVAARAPAGTPSRWSELARRGARELASPGRRRYCVQLELACEESTLERAYRAPGASGRIWIAPYDLRGRACYRVLWGRFASLEEARRARARVPAMFLEGRNRPAVIDLVQAAARPGGP
jgi:septal ring-binding cell division protein DamX